MGAPNGGIAPYMGGMACIASCMLSGSPIIGPSGKKKLGTGEPAGPIVLLTSRSAPNLAWRAEVASFFAHACVRLDMCFWSDLPVAR